MSSTQHLESQAMAIQLTDLRISCPRWVATEIDWDAVRPSDDDKMRLAILLSRANVTHGTGGPFGAAVFERESGGLVAVGMNLVVSHNNSTLHAEMVALMMAEQRAGSYSLQGRGRPSHVLYTSCDPCAMCLGATLWSGVDGLVCGAMSADAKAMGFDEGPVFPESFRYLERRGIEVVRGVLREEAAAVLRAYRDRGGVIYNGRS
jgi:tRNA(Arg) A34 adenosine deaminase TadA